jgi:hypothetical protein
MKPLRLGLSLCAFALTLLSGCATAPQNAETPVDQHAPILASNCFVRSVCVGLTAVDPRAYDGWAGDCPGCDLDARMLHARCLAAGAQGKLLLNEQATRENVEQTILRAGLGLRRGDLLILAISGHGGQVKDLNGDEADGLDETLCLWDGQMLDDHFLDILFKLPPGLRVLLISDQCHAEGNFRAFVRYAKKIVTLGALGQKPRARPLVRKAAAGWDGALIQFAGCREDSYSYGGAAGGKWTRALDRAFAQATTLRQWFDLAKRATDERQQPQWVEFGNVTDAFRFSVPLK